MAYSFGQLKSLWVGAGGNPAVANVMAAIALAESSGNPNATNHDSNGTVDRGLWQINSTHGALSTYNVQGNAQAAVQVYNSQGLGAWSTFTGGQYVPYYHKYAGGAPLPSNAILDSKGSGKVISSALGSHATGFIGTINGLLNPSTDWMTLGISTVLSTVFYRGAFTLGGILVIIMGGQIIMKSDTPNPVSAVTNVTKPITKALL